jgi:molybdopterin converting factor small subunit
MNVRLSISGRHYDAANAFPAELVLPEGASLADALDELRRKVEPVELPGSCLVAVGGKHLGTLKAHRPLRLCDGDELLLIAPVAGG